MAGERRTFREFFDPRVVSIFFLGFSSGLPLLLGGSTLSAWLAEEKVSLTDIGLMSWAGFAYTFKFLWAPLVSRLRLPLLSASFGQRRSWLLLTQLVAVAAILCLGSTEPRLQLTQTAIWTVVLAFASATQDIVIDGYRIEILQGEKASLGAANIISGYRIAMLVSGAGGLVIADQVGWHAAYYVMAALMATGVVTTLVIREPAAAPERLNQQVDSLLTFFKQEVLAPLVDFFRRPGWLVILLFIALYKCSDALIATMANPFYLSLGFTKTQVGFISKFYGAGMTVLGASLGGFSALRWGLHRSLLIAGIAQAVSNLLFVGLAAAGSSIPFLTFTISVENLAGGLGSAVFVAYLSGLCNIAFTTTQYALLSALSSFARTFLAGGSGWIVEQVGWSSFYVFTTIAGLPGLLLLLVLMRRYPAQSEPPAAAG